jgi:2-polyprenyl-3-methyl-5-hydroxy-6-metoxy-1,4-benzoquinol methylase
MLQRQGFTQVQGIDASPEMVVNARGLTKAPILCGDVLCMADEFGRGAFDMITAMNLQHHLGREGEWERFIQECRKTLRQGGILVMREPDTTMSLNGLRWMTRHRFFFKIQLLRGRLQSLVEEKALLDYFLARWPKYYGEYLKREGFQVIKDFCWMGHRIVVSRAQA